MLRALPRVDEYARRHSWNSAGWVAAVTPLAEALREQLPNGSEVEPLGHLRRLKVTWTAGPSADDVTIAVAEALDQDPEEQMNLVSAVRYCDWNDFTLQLERRSPAAAHGYAHLAAAISADCPECNPQSRSFQRTYLETINRRNSEQLAAHPGLHALTTLGIAETQLALTAETLGALGGSFVEAAALHHSRGHLQGLLELTHSLT